MSHLPQKTHSFTEEKQNVPDEFENAGPRSPGEPIETVHHDEGAVIYESYKGPRTWTDAEEIAVRRRVDFRLMPVLCMTYALQYYDKAMLSQAAIFGLRTELNLLIGNRYSFAAAIFYIGFIAGAYPNMWLAQRYPIERVASGVITFWGITLLLTTQCTNYQGLYAERFFLGFLEAGISPMFMVIVGSFYKKNEQAFRMGVWYSMTGLASVVSPLVNYGWGQVGNGVNTWRYMYYWAGALTIAWGIVLLWLLPGDPVHARGFDERQRYIMVARLRSNNAGVRNKHFKMAQIVELLLDLKFWITFSIALLSMICNGPVSSFLPIIIQSLGFSTLTTLLLFMPAGAIAAFFQLLVPYLASKKPGIRTYLIAGTQAVTIVSAVLLWKLPRSNTGGLLYACYTLTTYGSGYAVMMGLIIANTSGYTKRTASSAGLYMGYCIGNIIGPLLFKPEDAPGYAPAFLIVVVTGIAAFILAFAYRYVCIWDNRRRDRKGVEAFDNALDDDLTDLKNPQFRYVL